MPALERVLITGGAGFLGSHLCDRLIADGAEVLCVDNLLTGRAGNIAHLMDHPRFRFIHGDVAEELHVDGPLDAVLHFASPASPKDYLELPIDSCPRAACWKNAPRWRGWPPSTWRAPLPWPPSRWHTRSPGCWR